MLNHRVIPCLLMKDGGLVKTRRFKDPVYVGDPINAIRIFNEKEVDELVLLDISATAQGRAPNFELIEEIASECFMPLAYGGGVRTVAQVKQLLRLGVEKVIINTALHTDPEFVREAARTFGSQAIVASMDVKRKLLGRQEVFIKNAGTATGVDPVTFAHQVQELGVGEILLTAVDRDGTMVGYDLDLVAKIAQAVNVPVIASGGAGSLADFGAAVRQGHASAVSAGAMFVFYGPHRAVLISYPDYDKLRAALS
ncbi:AglZ/HisF2 family acetamidino modification protein [Pelomonas sp. P7]|uniref:imidazole glycerol-phosphate synthase n=1 Tax=Pelomonas caseinilytica TaxID=2906763 RepID=A0ABS8XFZ6_9BURK|nr:AglZ/HisF2 family acetamidino modification protein [Pelomonas sp. P7]MCE4538165.1 AglZ/HisF2 family acetamidino modification protein [Pelomonas sp. P7]